MQQSVPTQAAVSPDGNYWFDGQQWQPFAAVAIPKGPPRNPIGYVIASIVLPGLGSILAGKGRPARQVGNAILLASFALAIISFGMIASNGGSGSFSIGPFIHISAYNSASLGTISPVVTLCSIGGWIVYAFGLFHAYRTVVETNRIAAY